MVTRSGWRAQGEKYRYHNYFSKDLPILTKIFLPLLFYASFLSQIKSWPQMTPLLSQSKEQENFVDHTWIKCGSVRRIIVLAESLEQSIVNAAKTTQQQPPSVGGERRASSVYIFQPGEVPTAFELKQVIPINTIYSCRLVTVVSHAKGFLVGGTNGYFGVFERTEDRKDPFLLIKTLRAGDESIRSMAISSNKETVIACTKNDRLMTFSLSSVDMLEEGAVASFVDVFKGGFHQGAIHAMDICVQKSIAVTVGADRTIRVWNYIRGKSQIVHHSKAEEPFSVALHPYGFQCVVGFKERVRIYNILLDDIRALRELPLKHCGAIRYSDGGHVFACASGITVTVYSSVTFSCLGTFAGHIGIVRCLYFSRNDRLLYSASADGSLHSWDVLSLQKAEDPVGLDQTCAFTGLAVQHSTSSDDCHHLVCCGTDGYVLAPCIHWYHSITSLSTSLSSPFAFVLLL